MTLVAPLDEILRLRLHLHSNTCVNLEVINIEDPRIWEFARLSCFYIIYEEIDLIAE